MKTLIDTCVLSEARRNGGNPNVRERLAAIDDRDLYLSVITIGEVVKGIELLQASERKRKLEIWVRDLQDHHAERILPIDLRVCRIWGEITARAQERGVTIPAADALIAATALHHDLLILTRNTAHFQATGARIEDPWQDA